MVTCVCVTELPAIGADGHVCVTELTSIFSVAPLHHVHSMISRLAVSYDFVYWYQTVSDKISW